MHAAALFTLLALVGLGWALAVGDLTYRYVASWASSSMALPYRIAAVWGGPAGGMLLWALVLAVGTTVVAALLPSRSVLRAWTTALLAVMLLAVLAMTSFDATPFARVAFAPDDGRGVPMEWMRPIVLLQLPVGTVAMALASVPAVLVVMGAMGQAPWRTAARRWTMLCLSLLSVAMLLDWRRRYGDAAWADDWQWAPVHDGTAFAWAGVALLAVAVERRLRAGLTIGAGFAAFTLALVGLSLRRTFGWDGVHEWAQSATGRAVGWLALAAVLALAVEWGRFARQSAGWASRTRFTSAMASAIAALSLCASGFARSADVGVREGESVRVSDRFGATWTLMLQGVSKVGRDNVVSTLVSVQGSASGRARGFVTAEVRTLFSPVNGQAVAEDYFTGVRTGMLQDLRVDVREVGTAHAVLDVRFVPAMALLWLAGAATVIALLLAGLGAAPEEDPLESPPAPDMGAAA